MRLADFSLQMSGNLVVLETVVGGGGKIPAINAGRIKNIPPSEIKTGTIPSNVVADAGNLAGHIVMRDTNKSFNASKAILEELMINSSDANTGKLKVTSLSVHLDGVTTKNANGTSPSPTDCSASPASKHMLREQFLKVDLST